ncbi:MAG: DUF488 domain-containing protein [Planctomycetes bacterium]|nr:DUF488 domain-containing protein [Planctomycetota bacterium]
MKHVIHTLGLGARSLGTLLEALAESRVTLVVDVRRHPGSARHPEHAGPALHAALRAAGCEVHDLGPLLGGDRRGGYPAWMESAGFRRGVGKIEALAERGPVMLLCAEVDPDRCHRRFLAAALEARGWPVAHHRTTLSERAARGQMRVVRRTG